MRNICFVLLCLFSSTAFAQVFEHKLDMRQVAGIAAKSAAIESLEDSVMVFLIDRIGDNQAIEITFTTSAKFATIRAADSNQDQQKVHKSKIRPNVWFVYGKPGRYSITVIESDPEKGLDFVDAKFTIEGPAIPDNPDDKPFDPPISDFASLTKAAKDAAEKLADPTTRKALSDAYKAALVTTADKTFEESKTVITAARFAVLNARKGASRDVPWDQWRVAVDAELAKLVPAGDVAKYRQAINAVILGL